MDAPRAMRFTNGRPKTIYVFICVALYHVIVFGRPFVKRFALCYRTAVLSCLSCPVRPVCLCVHSGQTDGRMKMKLGILVGLGPGHTESDGHLALPRHRGTAPIFGPYLLRPNGCMDQDATWYGARPRPRRLYGRWGPRSPPKKGAEQPPQF